MRYNAITYSYQVANVYINCLVKLEKLQGQQMDPLVVGPNIAAKLDNYIKLCINLMLYGHNQGINPIGKGCIHMTSKAIVQLSLNNIHTEKTDKLQKNFVKLNKSNTNNVVDMGKMLIVLKDRLGYGNYAKWLNEECNFSQSTANKYTKVVNEYLNLDSELIPNLGIAKALILIDIEKSDREQYIIDNDIYNKSVSQVKALVKPKLKNDKNIESKAPTTDSINEIVSIFNSDIKNSLESHIKLLNDNEKILNDTHKQLLDKYNAIQQLINELAKVGG